MTRIGRPSPGFTLLICLTFCASLTGCRLIIPQESWQAPVLAPAELAPATRTTLRRLDDKSDSNPLTAARKAFLKNPSRELAFALAELCYSRAAQHIGEPAQIQGHYCLAASYAYFHLVNPLRLPGEQGPNMRMLEVYNSSVTEVVRALPGSRQSVSVGLPDSMATVALTFDIDPWQTRDMNEIEIVGSYVTQDFSHPNRRIGLGVPIVAKRKRSLDGGAADKFMADNHPFAVTAYYRPDFKYLLGTVSGAGTVAPDLGTIEFINPWRVETVEVAGKTYPLAADFSAPLVVSLNSDQEKRLDFIGLRQPERGDTLSGLYLLEPFQPEKIPVILVHGLLSDPHTWDEMINELQRDPEVRSHYQFAVYFYATGNPFVVTAGRLRKQLEDFQATFDPHKQNPNMQRMVVIGHSMGGLVSRLQIVSSEDKLWRLVADKSPDEVKTTDEIRTQLRETFFFEPAPCVTRAVFIATPHRGSSLAVAAIDLLGESFVRIPRGIVQVQQQLLKDNPMVFEPTFAHHIPSSLDNLAPRSNVIEAVNALAFSPKVKIHSIIGTGQFFPLLESGDGFVAVSSAHLNGVESEITVNANHTSIHRDPLSIMEVKRILAEHLAQ